MVHALHAALPTLPVPLRAVTEVREAGARVRSHTTVEHVRAMLAARNIPFDFIAFENAAAVNMSWYLKRSEYNCLRDAVSDNGPQLDRLRKIWSAYLDQRRKSAASPAGG